MRYSSLRDDPGYEAWCDLATDGRTVYVRVDGELIKDAMAADDVEGIVVRPRKTPHGNISIDQNTGDIVLETVRGSVELEIV